MNPNISWHTFHQPQLQTNYLQVWVEAGSTDDPVTLPGYIHFLEHLFVQHISHHHPSFLVTAWTDREWVKFSFSSVDLKSLLSITSSFSEPKPFIWENYQATLQSIADESRLARRSNYVQIQRAWAHRVFSDWEYQHSTLGNPVLMQQIPIKELQSNLARFLSAPKHIILISPSSHLEKFSHAEKTSELTSSAPTQSAISFSGTCVGFSWPKLTQPDKVTLALIETMLAKGWGSRLIDTLITQQGLAYQLHSQVKHFRNLSYWQISSSSSNPDLGIELKRALLEPVPFTLEEVALAKDYLINRLLAKVDQPELLGNWYGEQLVTGVEKPFSPQQFLEKIRDLKLETIRTATKRLLISEHWLQLPQTATRQPLENPS